MTAHKKVTRRKKQRKNKLKRKQAVRRNAGRRFCRRRKKWRKWRSRVYFLWHRNPAGWPTRCQFPNYAGWKWVWNDLQGRRLCGPIQHVVVGWDASRSYSYSPQLMIVCCIFLPKLIPNGAKIMSIELEAAKTKFCDSLNFLPMLLKAYTIQYFIDTTLVGLFSENMYK